MKTNALIGLTGGNNETFFRVVAVIGRGRTEYYPAIKNGRIMEYYDFDTIEDYLAHKVTMERETIRYTVAGNAVSAESAIKKMGIAALAINPTTVDVFPDQPYRVDPE